MNTSARRQVKEIVEQMIKEQIQSRSLQRQKPLVVANWKMNMSLEKALHFLNSVQSDPQEGTVVICPPYPLLYPINIAMKKLQTGVQLGAQNVHWKDHGAHTGEVSVGMLQEVGCNFVLIGHSERRMAGESEEAIQHKVKQVLQSGMYPIVCVGENSEEFKQGLTSQIVKQQIEAALKNLPNISNMIIAYEPVWAIGTGQSATPYQAEKVHQTIRQSIHDLHGSIAQRIPILYGGSVHAENARSLAAYENIDGVLVGGASLEVKSFQSIIRSFNKELGSA
ncbi:triose-phosphate isomerase [Pseudogracilibacillus auburnensis]|uniref:triose-phosphate isomerase n=1 Tax=Pseudogracilibacillus auburnensis TaxID=1494959 RepID=UPI001A97B6EA|nr:triose-phosphate isomerase [Pseudogracilibacillus auburnensis]MBO1005822.1 triose-phosphate isomerase [Pseudogracilibacillus auburnensis]